MTTYKKLIVDKKLMRIFPVINDRYPEDVKPLMDLKGIEIQEATAEESVNDYIRRYGEPVI